MPAGDFSSDFNADFSGQSNINVLPLYRATIGVGADEDMSFSIAFTLNDGITPLSLGGIGFTLTVGIPAAPACVLTVGNGLLVSGNTLTAFYPAASKTAWSGNLPIGLLATDPTGSPVGGPRNVDILTGVVSAGAPAPLSLTRVTAAASALMGAANAQLVANTAAIVALQAAVVPATPMLLDGAPVVPLTGGWYLVTTPGLTIPIAAPAAATGLLIVGDATGSDTPAIAIAGTVNGSAGGVLLTGPGESVTLGAVPALSSWWMQ